MLSSGHQPVVEHNNSKHLKQDLSFLHLERSIPACTVNVAIDAQASRTANAPAATLVHLVWAVAGSATCLRPSQGMSCMLQQMYMQLLMHIDNCCSRHVTSRADGYAAAWWIMWSELTHQNEPQNINCHAGFQKPMTCKFDDDTLHHEA